MLPCRDVHVDTDTLTLDAMRYYPNTGEFYQYWHGDDRSDFDDMPYKYPREDYQDAIVTDTDAEKGYVTIGMFRQNKPQGTEMSRIYIFGAIIMAFQCSMNSYLLSMNSYALIMNTNQLKTKKS